MPRAEEDSVAGSKRSSRGSFLSFGRASQDSVRTEGTYVDPDLGAKGALPDQLIYRSTDFDVLQTIGTGRFSRVKLVRNILEDRIRCAKIIKKTDIVHHGLFRYVSTEVKLLRTLDHPFIIKSLGKFQDEDAMYVIFDVLRGGDLHRKLQDAQDPQRTLHEQDRVDAGGMEEEHVKFYCTQIVTALQHLHGQRIVYRGMKPENICIDDDGYAVLIDLGLCGFLPYDEKGKVAKTYTICGDPEYTAPEVLLRHGYGRECDTWALGVMVYELLTGYPPFYGSHALDVYRKVQEGECTFPKKVTGQDGTVYPGFGGGRKARHFIQNLLQKKIKKRLGGEDGAATGKLRRDAWFSGTDWKSVTHRTLQCPFVPSLKRGDERLHFDEFVEDSEAARELKPLETEDAEELDAIVNDRSTAPGTPFHLKATRIDEEDDAASGVSDGSASPKLLPADSPESPQTLEAPAPDAPLATQSVGPDEEDE